MDRTTVLVLGAGPTGLGAALRSLELGADTLILEAAESAGGLARSIRDVAGFTWDLGSHLQFSHYARYDRLLDEALSENDWLWHDRVSSCLVASRNIPYPIQSHLHRLPPQARWECVRGLLAAQSAVDNHVDFASWLTATFGEGLCELFMRPYNRKVWACDPVEMSSGWIRDRVAVPDLESVLKAVCCEEDPCPWGPNATFRYPRQGGTGALWTAVARMLPEDCLQTSTRVTAVDLNRRTVTTEDGRSFGYEVLISTIPLTRLSRMSGDSEKITRTRELVHARTTVVGLGIAGEPPADGPRESFYVYVPDPEIVFHRATYLGRMSPANVPEGCWSLMVEVSVPGKGGHRCSPKDRINRVVSDAGCCGLVDPGADIVSRCHVELEYGYPVPSLNRDATLAKVLPELREQGVYSRGRFGAWRYEISNQDHSFMQGVEAVQHALSGDAELTLEAADLINSRHNPFPYEEWSAVGTRRVTV